MSYELNGIGEKIEQDLLESSLVKLYGPSLLLDPPQIELYHDFLLFDCLLDKA